MGKWDFLKSKVQDHPPPPPAPGHEMDQVTQLDKSIQPEATAPVRSSFGSRGSHSQPESIISAQFVPSVAPSIRKSQQYQGQQPLEVVKNQVMIKYLYQQQGNNGWRSGHDVRAEGVVLRMGKENWLCQPTSLVYSPLLTSLKALNVQAAMTVHSPAIEAYLEGMPHTVDMPLLNGLAVQIIDTVENLAGARVHQFAAVIASKSMLVVWDDDAVDLLARAKRIEWELMQLLWNSNPYEHTSDGGASKVGSKTNIVLKEKEMSDDDTLEHGGPKPRPTIFINTILVSLSMLILATVLGLGCRQILLEVMNEKGYGPNPYNRVAYLALTPVWAFFGMFFFNVLVSSLCELFGPIQQLKINSKYYSAYTVRRLTRDLPHVTVQCPVYKEGLEAVIAPTVASIKKAISTYELQGGSANMFWNDDGLQLMDKQKQQERINFYSDHSIGWVARPPHDNSPGGFKRAGKFKKASNMNFALEVSCQMEDRLNKLERGPEWSAQDEGEATSWALEQTVKEGGNIAMAHGNIRIGDYILIIDSDTRVPADCLLDAVSELEASPEVAILQFSSGVMQVVHNYFENGITFFTNLIYSAIRYGASNGDVAPFVGHNAILRWSAVQDVAFKDKNGVLKFWSESHVSEDFDIALRLQIKGYITRLAAWAGDGFKEGVSLTVYDELARWQKYAYGCNELVFNPIRTWLWRGPFTPLFRQFVFSNMPFASKINIISYVGTYYAIAASWILTVVNYFIIGWFKGYIDDYYISSWKIWFILILVFSGLGNLSLAVMRYRAGEKAFVSSLMENFKWIFLLFIFLGGISVHISQAILAHMFEIDMSWGATAKELTYSNFFIEVPKVLKNFWFSMLFCIVFIAGMVVLAIAEFIPYDWHIRQLEAIIPMASLLFSHMLLPLALNPALMTFAW